MKHTTNAELYATVKRWTTDALNMFSPRMIDHYTVNRPFYERINGLLYLALLTMGITDKTPFFTMPKDTRGPVARAVLAAHKEYKAARNA